MKQQKILSSITLVTILNFVLVACSPNKNLTRVANNAVLDQSIFQAAHVGISIYDPATNKYLYTHNADKYFIPASNTKLFTCYAAMKYLGDSILAARYRVSEDGTLLLQATGDPTFLHPDFKSQPLLKFLQQPHFAKIGINTRFEDEPLGSGWTWNDFQATYAAERDPFPMYGNVATFIFNGDSLRTIPGAISRGVTGSPEKGKPWNVTRDLGGQSFIIESGKGSAARQKEITLSMQSGNYAASFLADTLHKTVTRSIHPLSIEDSKPFYSQPTDSLLKITMHRSDNFFAEQLLLMASNAKLGVMSDRRMVDTLLKTDLSGLPQKPRWLDGSGLSRYNLFSPNDFIFLLNKMKNEFAFTRLQEILPGANEGTLAGLYKGYEGHIFAKTGTLSNHVALSGYLITRRNKPLIFSVMVGNHQSAASDIRKGIEMLLTSVIDKYR